MKRLDINIVPARQDNLAMRRWRSVNLALGIALTLMFTAYVSIAIWLGLRGIDIQFNSAGGR
jgi:hypothetical protein